MWAWRPFALPKKPPKCGHGDTLYYQKTPYTWAWGHLHCQKVIKIWVWGHFALQKKTLNMGMGTLCTAQRTPKYGHGDTLHCQKNAKKWALGQFALPKRPIYMGMPPPYIWDGVVVGIKPPPTPFLAIFDPWGGFMPPGGSFIPPFGGRAGLFPQRGGFIPPFGPCYHPFGMVLSPIFGDFIPLLGAGGGGVAPLYVNQESQSWKTGCLVALCRYVLLYVEHPWGGWRGLAPFPFPVWR